MLQTPLQLVGRAGFKARCVRAFPSPVCITSARHWRNLAVAEGQVFQNPGEQFDQLVSGQAQVDIFFHRSSQQLFESEIEIEQVARIFSARQEFSQTPSCRRDLLDELDQRHFGIIVMLPQKAEKALQISV